MDEVFPKVGIRQWVISFPMPVRFILAKNPKVQAKCLTIIHRAISTFIQKKAKAKGLRASLQPSAVTLVQRFGGSLNLNVHYHMLFLEGGFYETHQGPRFWWIDHPTDEEVKNIVATLAKRVIRFLKKKGYFTRAACAQDELEGALPEEEMTQDELLPELQAASVHSRIAMGERRGQRVRRLGLREFAETGNIRAELEGPLCAVAAGFSLHADVYCAPWERQKLEKICRYIARPAVAEDRLSMRPSGDVVLKLKRPYSDGTSHLLFSGLEFIEKLAALVPPPRIHLTRFFGCLAPNAKIRSAIAPKKEQEKQENTESCKPEIPSSDNPDLVPTKKMRKSWAELLARVFAIDITICPRCCGELKILAAIVEPGAIKKILSHLGLHDKPPDITPARIPSQMSFA